MKKKKTISPAAAIRLLETHGKLLTTYNVSGVTGWTSETRTEMVFRFKDIIAMMPVVGVLSHAGKKYHVKATVEYRANIFQASITFKNSELEEWGLGKFVNGKDAVSA